MTMSWRLWKSSRWPRQCSMNIWPGKESRIAITWEGSLSQNSRRGLCEGWSLAARIPEVTERKQWYLIMGGRIKDMKYVHLVPNDETAPVNIGWGFLSHIPHAPQLVQTCLVKFNEKSKKKSVPRPTSRDQFESILVGVSTSAQPAYPGKSSLRNDK